MNSSSLLAVAVTAALSVVTLSTAAALELPPGRTTPHDVGPKREPAVDHQVACNEPVPHGIAAVTPVADRITLEVEVVLDGITRRRARALMAKAAQAYEPLGIDLRPYYRAMRLTANERNPAGLPAAEMNALLGLVRHELGGSRPQGRDLVYLLTDKDIYSINPQGERQYGVGGYAQCIGGVASDGSAFAIGEGHFPFEDEPVAGPVMMYRNSSAKIAAHELGHLMGGRHEHGNCVEGVASEVVEEGDYISPCTLMAQQLFSINFGSFEAAIVRHYAEEFAAP